MTHPPIRFETRWSPSAVGAVLMLLAGSVAAASPADFFKGKTVTYIVATSPGGSYDLYGRLVAENMQKQMPGTRFVVKNVPGAGHIIGANAIFAAKPDGLTIGTFNTGLIYAQMIGQEGVKFDLTKMSWIGKAASEPRVMMVSAQSPIKTFEDLKASKEPVPFATSGVGSSSNIETKLLTDTLKLPIKIIPSYAGNEGEMAMRRGEVFGGVGSRSSWEGFVKNGYGRFIVQIGGKDKDLPQLSKFATDPAAKAALALVQSQGDLARLTAGPSGIPAERLEVLRGAYKRALSDKGLQERAAKLGLPLDPDFGDDVLNQVRAALNQPPETIALLAKTQDLKPPTPPALKVAGPLIEVNDKGRAIVFAGPDQKPVQSKPSGSRTRITVDGKDASRGDLKVGMNCEISYQAGGDNEPVEMACK